MGDAAASAHFSSAPAPSWRWKVPWRWPTTCIPSRISKPRSEKYEGARRTEVLKLQSAARNSLEWFEEVERYLHLDPFSSTIRC